MQFKKLLKNVKKFECECVLLLLVVVLLVVMLYRNREMFNSSPGPFYPGTGDTHYKTYIPKGFWETNKEVADMYFKAQVQDESQQIDPALGLNTADLSSTEESRALQTAGKIRTQPPENLRRDRELQRAATIQLQSARAL